MSKVMTEAGVNTVSFRKRTYTNDENTRSKDYFYAIPVENIDYSLYTYKHLVLAISELIATDKALRAVILEDHPFLSEIRPMLKVLAIDLAKPFYSQSLFPVGDNVGHISDINEADLIIAYNLTELKEVSLLKKVIERDGNNETDILLYVSDQALPQKNTDILSDELRIILDRDNFGKILSESLEKRISKNQA